MKHKKTMKENTRTKQNGEEKQEEEE